MAISTASPKASFSTGVRLQVAPRGTVWLAPQQEPGPQRPPQMGELLHPNCAVLKLPECLLRRPHRGFRYASVELARTIVAQILVNRHIPVGHISNGILIPRPFAGKSRRSSRLWMLFEFDTSSLRYRAIFDWKLSRSPLTESREVGVFHDFCAFLRHHSQSVLNAPTTWATSSANSLRTFQGTPMYLPCRPDSLHAVK